MTFTTLHEVAHVEGADDLAFQEALLAANMTRRDVEEDACEAFAAAVLLPDSLIDPILDQYGGTARGLAALIEAQPQASMEACAVAVAHRLRAPGYVALIDGEGPLRFAARSGDSLPLARGSDQTASDLSSTIQGSGFYQGVGSLVFPSGVRTPRMYLDAMRVDGLVLAVAVTDKGDWIKLHTPDTESVSDRLIEAYCESCGENFLGLRNCQNCGHPVHDLCGRCACEHQPVRGEHRCTKCNLVQSPHMFRSNPDVCEDCV